jgi:hypothetical protein
VRISVPVEAIKNSYHQGQECEPVGVRRVLGAGSAQLSLGMYPVDDPQALRNPRRDNSYILAGLTGLQLENTSGPSTDETGVPSGGSRIIQWGYAPVGGSRANDVGLTPNNLALSIQIGTVTVVTT